MAASMVFTAAAQADDQVVGPFIIGPIATNWATNAAMGDGTHTTTPAIVAPMSFTQFDPSTHTGPLTSVTIDVAVSFSGTMTVQNQDPSEVRSLTAADLTTTMTVDMFNDYDGATDSLIEFDGFPFHANNKPGLRLFTTWTTPTLPINLAVGEEVTSDTLTGSGTASMVVTGADLAAYIGTGSYDVGCSALSQDNFATSGSNVFTSSNVNATCEVTVTYHHTTTPAPAPAPLALMGLGLFGMASVRRMRNKK